MPALRSHALTSHQNSTQEERSEGVVAAPLALVVTERLPREDARISMNRVIAAWGFGAAFINITSGAIYTVFARNIGANDFIFGILAGAAPLLGFLQIIAARLIEGSGKRKRQMMTAGLIGRLLWVLAALMPLLASYFPGIIGKQQVLTWFMACVILSGAFQAFNTPAFFSWMTDLVPARLRPTFFARRIQVGTWVALGASIIAGLIADYWPNLTTYCLILAFAGICGVLDIVYFFGVREPKPNNEKIEGEKPRRKAPPLLDMVRVPLRDLPTRRFLLFVAFLMFSYGIAGPFVWIHTMEYLNLSKTMTGVLLNVIPLIATALTMKFWADVIRRYGNRPVMRICSMIFALTTVAWLLARPGAWDLLPLLIFIGGITTAGMELANTNLIAGLSPHIPRSSMTAVFSIVAGLSLALSTWCGGALAQSLHWIDDGHYTIAGIKLVNYHILFLLAFAVRLFNATFIAPLLHEPESTGTVDTVKEIFPEIAQSFAARVTRPLGTRQE